MEKNKLKIFYSNIIITLNDILLELFNNDRFFQYIITTPRINDFLIFYSRIYNPYKIISYIIRHEISKGNTLIFRENTYSVTALINFINMGGKYKGRINNKKNIMRSVIELVTDFFSLIKTNHNLRLVVDIVKTVSEDLNIPSTTILIPLLISKLLIPIIIKKDKQYIVSKILQHVASNIVNSCILTSTDPIIYLDYYYSHKEDLEYIKSLIEKETTCLFSDFNPSYNLLVDVNHKPKDISKVWIDVHNALPKSNAEFILEHMKPIVNIGNKLLI